ncbi:hypothetical protein NDU88_000886, partial [Pleurodeles waltl]
SVPFLLTSYRIDQGGRYVVLEGKLDGKQLSLIGIYAPNTALPEFLNSLTPALLTNPAAPAIWGGDFNNTPDLTLDRSSPPTHSAANRCPEGPLATWASNMGLCDLWRMKHPQHREYSFYSVPHKVYTRIDLLWGTRDICTVTNGIEYLAKSLSDHSP